MPRERVAKVWIEIPNDVDAIDLRNIFFAAGGVIVKRIEFDGNVFINPEWAAKKEEMH